MLLLDGRSLGDIPKEGLARPYKQEALMKDVMICCVSESTPKGKFIQWLTGCKFNHVYIEFFSQDWNCTQAIDINERGVNQLPAEKAGYDKATVEKYFAKETMVKALMDNRNLVGNKYDWRGLMGGLIKIVAFRLFGSIIEKPWHSSGRLFCSEYVATLLMVSDLENFALHPWMAKPRDVWMYCRRTLDRFE